MIISQQTFVPQFIDENNEVGGEVDGQETLRSGEYLVSKDISVRVGGRLTLQSGVTLRFLPSVGIMVAGKLEARGKSPNDIRLTLQEQEPMNDTVSSVRLLGGKTEREGRLQVLLQYIYFIVGKNGDWIWVGDHKPFSQTPNSIGLQSFLIVTWFDPEKGRSS
jgi:hypothetical protein